MCGTEVGEMNEIHTSLPVFFPACEVFVERMNEVDTVTFASPDLFISRVPYEEGFYFSSAEVFLYSQYLP
jgi:hypothetical protein